MPGPGEVELTPRGSAWRRQGAGWEGGGREASSEGLGGGCGKLLGSAAFQRRPQAWARLGPSGHLWTQADGHHICLAYVALSLV